MSLKILEKNPQAQPNQYPVTSFHTYSLFLRYEIKPLKKI